MWWRSMTDSPALDTRQKTRCGTGWLKLLARSARSAEADWVSGHGNRCALVTGMRLFNSATNNLEKVPTSGDLGVYVCGITPYAAAHIGHAMVYLTYDLLVRRLRDRGQEVAYVRNITDVDDSILEFARAHKVNYLELGESEEARFASEMAQLNLVTPDLEPRATQTIQSTVELVRELTAAGV